MVTSEYVKYLEKTDLGRQKVDEWWPPTGVRNGK